MKRFNWQISTIKEIAEELENITATRLGTQIGHYRKAENLFMLEKIEKARKLLRYRQLSKMTEGLKEEIRDYL